VTKQTKKHIILSAVLALVVALGLLAARVDYQFLADKIASANFQPSQEVADLADKIHLTEKGRVILLASQPAVADRDLFNANCVKNTDENVNVLGCYHDRKIFVFAINHEQLSGIKEVTLAHELLHAIWSRLSDSEKTRLGAELRAVYAENAQLADKMQHYAASELENELHSVIGTEIKNLPETLEQHYAKYFQNRPAIAAIYAGYSAVFEELKAESDQLSAQMTALEQAIADLKTEYDERWDTLNAEIANFNQRANSGAFTSEAAFQKERAVLEKATADLSSLYTSINQKINDYNTLVEKYNTISVHLSELANSISSTAPPAPEL
jgi:hypothetical protein